MRCVMMEINKVLMGAVNYVDYRMDLDVLINNSNSLSVNMTDFHQNVETAFINLSQSLMD